MQDLENQIAKAKKSLDKKEKNSASDSSAAVTLLIDLISGIAVGGFLGYIIDEYFNTQPAFMITMMLLGITAGFYVFYKQLMRRS